MLPYTFNFTYTSDLGLRGVRRGAFKGFLRQRARRNHHRALQNRSDPAKGTWKSIDDVEFATLEWIDRFNNRRLLEPIGDIPPVEYEMLYWTESGRTDTVGLKELSLH